MRIRGVKNDDGLVLGDSGPCVLGHSACTPMEPLLLSIKDAKKNAASLKKTSDLRFVTLEQIIRIA